MMSDPIITTENLWHIYPEGNVTAVKDVSISINKQEIIGVIGQNGSGKTTLVKHFIGLLKPTKGTVIVNGMDTAPMKLQDIAENVGYVYQNPNHQLFATTVQDELDFGPTNLGLSEEEVIERREQAIEFFDLEDMRFLHPYRIGFPLRKLVGMASVYTMRPDVFILDEPTTGQDNITTQTVYKLIHRLRDDGATIICVAHDMILLAEVVERMLVMRDAELILDGTPRDVFSNNDIMASTHLMPPQITTLSINLSKKQNNLDDVVLSVDELVKKTQNKG
jgi:energy-coupling factor transport system ATP-binding protein